MSLREKEKNNNIFPYFFILILIRSVLIVRISKYKKLHLKYGNSKCIADKLIMCNLDNSARIFILAQNGSAMIVLKFQALFFQYIFIKRLKFKFKF